MLRVLEPEPDRRRRRRVLQAVFVIGLAAAGQRLAAQVASAEALYEAGALRAAADSFAARAERSPRVAAHWYNLGATLYRAGDDGKATVAWTRAARLAPRDGLVRRGRLLLPPDAASEPLLAVGPATPAEWAVLGLAAWLLFWGAVVFRPRAARLAPLAALLIAVAVPASLEWRRRTRPVGVVLAPSATVRGAPYGTAAGFGSLPAGAAVLLGRRHGAWVEVRRDDGVHGWLLQGEVAAL
jgi:tetratricopeptide (TPR) repeat protein